MSPSGATALQNLTGMAFPGRDHSFQDADPMESLCQHRAQLRLPARPHHSGTPPGLGLCGAQCRVGVSVPQPPDFSLTLVVWSQSPCPYHLQGLQPEAGSYVPYLPTFGAGPLGNKADVPPWMGEEGRCPVGDPWQRGPGSCQLLPSVWAEAMPPFTCRSCLSPTEAVAAEVGDGCPV